MSAEKEYKPVGERFGPKRERPPTPESENSSDEGLSEFIPADGQIKRVRKEVRESKDGNRQPMNSGPRVVSIEDIIGQPMANAENVEIPAVETEKKADFLEIGLEGKKESPETIEIGNGTKTETVEEKQEDMQEIGDQHVGRKTENEADDEKKEDTQEIGDQQHVEKKMENEIANEKQEDAPETAEQQNVEISAEDIPKKEKADAEISAEEIPKEKEAEEAIANGEGEKNDK